MTLPRLVLDTNIVLDVFLFGDPRTQALRQALADARVQWLATAPMRDELERVLAYTHLLPRLAYYQLEAAHVLAHFDTFAQLREVAPRASAVCKDPDDQRFIDLAVAHQATLLSKDKAVLCMRKRLQALGANALTALAA